MVFLWPIHVDVWQKPIQYRKAIILQVKITKLKNIVRFVIKKKLIFYYSQFINTGIRIGRISTPICKGLCQTE